VGVVYSTRGLILSLVALGAVAVAAPNPSVTDPKISSIFPAAAERGKTFEAVLRGTNLRGARALMFECDGIEARIRSTAADTSEPRGKALERGPDLVRLEITLHADAELGSVGFRVITARGVSNKLTMFITSERVLSEAEAARPLSTFPVVINGKIPRAGDVHSYTIEASAGQMLTIESASFSEAFDPSVSIFEPSGSWFDPHRLNLVASNDEPLAFPGLSTDARLVQRLPHAGTWILRVQGFHGSGGPDCVYRLRIVSGLTPAPLLHPTLESNWEERQFTRPLTTERMHEISARAAEEKPAPIHSFQAAPEGAGDPPIVTLPGIIEGRITQPAQADVIRFKLDSPQALAMEIETPEATLPRFNPVVRLMDPGGREIATDVYTKLNNNGLYMMKMIEAKTTVNLTATGEYTLQIREITTNGAGEDFHYRVLLRPQVPHIGKLEITEDHLNLEAGSVHPVIITADREEGFSGYVAYEAKGLPEGVSILPGIEDHAEPPPLPNGGRLERYVAKPQRAALMVSASPDAPPTDMPVRVRLFARLTRQGRLSEPILVKEMLLMVMPAAKPGAKS
jgi:hypothetical protein